MPFQPCDAGHVCRSGVSTLCASGFFCKQGNVSPRRCPLLSDCVTGSSFPLLYMPYVLSVGFVLSLLLYVGIAKIITKLRRKPVTHTLPVVTDLGGSLLQYATLVKCISHLSVTNASVKDRSTNAMWLSKLTVVVFNAGGFNAVMAASGVGKTLLLDLMRSKSKGSNIKATGKVHIITNEGERKTFDTNRRQSRMSCGFVPQDDIVFDDLTVEENLMFSALLRLSVSKSIIHEIVDDVIHRLGLVSIRHCIVGSSEKRSISGGQRKRVNIGLEIVSLPSILIMDEPTSGLDAKSSYEIISICRTITEHTGMTIVSVLHQPRFNAFLLFDLVLLLNKSGVVFTGSPVRSISYFMHFCSFDFGESDDNPADAIIDLISVESMTTVWENQGRKWLRRHEKDHPRFDSIIRSLPHTIGITTRIDQAHMMRDIVEIPLNPRASHALTESHRHTKVIHFNTVNIMRRRAISLYRSAWWIQLTLPWVTALIIGSIQGPVWDLAQFPTNIALANVALAVLSTVTFIPTFSSDKQLMWRDTENRVSLLEHVVAYNVVDIVWICLVPFCFFLPYVCFTIPQAAFLNFYLAGVALSWWVSGVAYLVSSMELESKWAMLVGVFVSVIFGAFLQGMNPTVASTKHSMVGYILNISYNRWLIEILVAREFHFEENDRANVVFSIMSHFGWCGVDRSTLKLSDVWERESGFAYKCPHVYTAYAWMLGLGLLFRILSYLILLEIKTRCIEYYVFRFLRKGPKMLAKNFRCIFMNRTTIQSVPQVTQLGII